MTFIAIIGFGLYFLSLLAISAYFSKSASDADYLVGGKKSIWWLVSLGMVSDCMSGVTYVSVPGYAAINGFQYLFVSLGYALGYILVAYVLLPIYYKNNLISIYQYLGTTLGLGAEKLGSVCFLVSRMLGAAARLYLALHVLHQYILEPIGVPIYIAYTLSIAFMVIYTIKGGIKSLVWTDAFQSIFLIAGVTAVYWGLVHKGFPDGFSYSKLQELSPPLILSDWKNPQFFLRNLLGGFFLTVAMSGVDQNIMQKNLSCKSLKQAQWNLLLFSVLMFSVNILFVSIGPLMKLVDPELIASGIPSDGFLPQMILGKMLLGPVVAGLFVVGLFSATFSSADSVLTTLSSSIELDLLSPAQRKKWPLRKLHLLVATGLLLLIFVLQAFHFPSIITVVLKSAGYTYGPLVGLFSLTLIKNTKWYPSRLPYVALFTLSVCAILDYLFSMGFELIVIHGVLFVGTSYLVARKTNREITT